MGGEPDLARLALNTLPGDAGGPVLDAGGGVLGMLLPEAQSGRTLPEGVQFALDREALQDVLAQAGMAAAGTNSATPIDPVDLSAAATGMTVLVSCWDCPSFVKIAGTERRAVSIVLTASGAGLRRGVGALSEPNQ